MTQSTTLTRAISPPVIDQHRRITHRTRGHGHGPIVRLMSPSELGEIAKPFVFLDLFEADMRSMRDAMALHPHSGIATVTVFTRGDVHFDDPHAGIGRLPMAASSGCEPAAVFGTARSYRQARRRTLKAFNFGWRCRPSWRTLVPKANTSKPKA